MILVVPEASELSAQVLANLKATDTDVASVPLGAAIPSDSNPVLLVAGADGSGAELVAALADVHLVVVTAHGADPELPGFLGQQGDLERTVRESGLAHTIVRTHLLMEDLLALGGTGTQTGPVPWLDTRDVAEFCAAVLRAPAMHAGAVYDLTGPEAIALETVADLPPSVVAPAAWLLERVAWYRSNDPALISPMLPVMLGKPARTVADFVAENSAAYQP